ncbi:DNA-binding transcriptional LysR family regulator [Nocardioides salarius]|uniref:DNA-binding transcriptional LysR family regulator n=1 Tax=Nocardioides salarius TaxID=374513 RepID=A0ABS2MAH0_9ACTN|nr:LysR substrate-binding domain-containing protein [Nocardioides salarius]MBM7508142.1 DNA-binding transcriptional LysR family regulator [Nocardioides salarius]
MTRDPDLETLRLLVAVSESTSLNAAARTRGLSQPAASARVKEFEARWQVAILHRSARGSKLTRDGEAAVAWARELLHAADTMVAAMHTLASQRHAAVVVAASLTIAEQLLPRWLGELHVSHPDIQPELRVVNSEAVAAEVRAGNVDIGFIESSLFPVGLARAVVGHDQLEVVVARDHRWARRSTPLTRDELAAARWVLREPGSGTRSTFESALRRQPEIALEGSSTAALIGAAVAGVGPAVASRLAVRAELETGRLRAVPTELDLRRPLTAVWRSGERLSEAASLLLSTATRASDDGRSRRQS